MNFATFAFVNQSNLRKHVRKNHPEALMSSRGKKEELNLVNNNAADNGNNENNPKKNLAAAVLAAALRIKKGSIKQQQKAARNAAAAAAASSSSPDKKAYQCQYCDKAFSRQDQLDTHSKNRHQDPQFAVVSADAFMQQHQLQLQHDGGQTAVLEHSQLHDGHHRLQPVGVPHSEEATTTTTIQTESGQLINVAVINSDKITTLDPRAAGANANAGSIILQPLTGTEVSNLKPLQILTAPHHALNQDATVFDSIIQHHNSAEVATQQQQQQTHFATSNLMAVSGPNGQTHHITLQPMTQSIPTSSGAAGATTHHLMEPADANSLPVIQSADGQTHYLIIQPH